MMIQNWVIPPEKMEDRHDRSRSWATTKRTVRRIGRPIRFGWLATCRAVILAQYALLPCLFLEAVSGFVPDSLDLCMSGGRGHTGAWRVRGRPIRVCGATRYVDPCGRRNHASDFPSRLWRRRSRLPVLLPSSLGFSLYSARTSLEHLYPWRCPCRGRFFVRSSAALSPSPLL